MLFVAHKHFDDLEVKRSSTWMELKPVRFTLKKIAAIFHTESSVKLCTVSKAVVFNTDSGSN